MASNRVLGQPVKDFLYTAICISTGAYFGAYIRVLINDSSSFWPNILGTFLIGITNPIKTWPAYGKTGFTTGFCGSLTTFSAWISNWSQVSLNKVFNTDGERAQYSIRQLIAFQCCFIIAYVVGRDAYHFIVNTFCQEKKVKESEELEHVKESEQLERSGCAKLEKNVSLFWHWLAIAELLIHLPLTALIIAGMCVEWSGQQTCYALILSQFGALLRWQLGRFNEPFLAFGTLAANVGAVLTLVLSQRYLDGSNFWVYGLNSGFCACLSTVSSMVKDSVSIYENLKLADKRKMWCALYVFLTFGISVMIGLLVWGT